MITSKDNKWLKTFRAVLRGTGPSRDEFIGIESPKLVEEALRLGLAAEALLLSESGEALGPHILGAASESEGGIERSRILRTTDKLFRSISATEAPQGVAALFRQPNWSFEDLLETSRGGAAAIKTAPLIVVLAGVQDPGNVGTIVRSAEAFGATGLIASRGTADPWSPKALRGSAGAALRLPLLRHMAIPILLAQLRVARIKIYAAVAETAIEGTCTEEIARQADLRQPAAIFIGSEGAGLPAEVMSAADATISIRISHSMESLNAGVAASILLYEAARQRFQTSNPSR